MVQLSIIIPARNEEKFIPLCIAGIRNSINSEIYEIILVDNGSTDNTLCVAKKLGCRTIYNSKEGPAATRNAGASIAKGNYIAFIDADCVIPKNWFFYALEHFRNKAVAVGFKISPDFKNSTWVERASFDLNQRRGIEVSKNVINVRWLGTSNLILEKKLFDKIGGFNEKLITCEDYDLCQRIGDYGKLILDAREYVVHMREDKSLRMLFSKELHRGQNSLINWSNKGFNLYEAPSILVPVGFIFAITFGLAIIVHYIYLGLFLLILGILPLFALSLKPKKAKKNPILLLQYISFNFIYLTARGLSCVKEVLGLFLKIPSIAKRKQT
ncbi:glycosyltransferase [uncultured Desulfosarcina sp.]|uniref:glycosyltransferase n=1 Tax=uncultured Desulfosarcina sp. TaxID=218289 RepID=UPI0029C6E6C7|nr:glycosyltransferase [uncultured Desulfosarcina sp.]